MSQVDFVEVVDIVSEASCLIIEAGERGKSIKEEWLTTNGTKICFGNTDEWCMIISLEDYCSIQKIYFQVEFIRGQNHAKTEDIKIEAKLIGTKNQEMKAIEKLLTSLNATIEAGDIVARHLVIKIWNKRIKS